ncbi:MAG: alkaline phosphatase family protein [bacterium]|nr:alkaline phosphatase family protein [bacterium]
MTPKVLIIGLDCAPPELLFDQFLDDLPNIRALLDGGLHGPLHSTIPPITVPAWMSMVTGKDPGTLGFYGLRNRPDHSYRPMEIANSRLLQDNTLWDILSSAGKNVLVVGVPQTYPPKPVNGCLISSFLTPDNHSTYTHPPDLQPEIERIANGYILDVRNFRTQDRESLLHQIYEMTEKRFRVTRHLMQTRPWDFCMHVEMGTDRIHHAFWRYLDETHRGHEPNSKFRHAIRDYYRYLDQEIGTLIDLAGKDTHILLVSDHGAKRIDGGIRINQWLMQEGYLKLKHTPETPAPLENLEIDWPNTTAWGAGGYYARIFLNISGREPQGRIAPESYNTVLAELSTKLSAIPDSEGRPLETKVYNPREIYRTCNGVPPDLIVHFGDLLWRSVGTVGGSGIHTTGNDTGPDDANHSQHGVFILRSPQMPSGQTRTDLDIRDVAPTVLTLMGLPLPADMQGRSVIHGADPTQPAQIDSTTNAESDAAYTDEEKTEMEDRLRSLGYL